MIQSDGVARVVRDKGLFTHSTVSNVNISRFASVILAVKSNRGAMMEPKTPAHTVGCFTGEKSMAYSQALFFFLMWTIFKKSLLNLS